MTSTFHPVTYHSCTGRLVLERDTLTFQADDDDNNHQEPSNDISTRLKWSRVTKLRANKTTSRVPKLRFTITKKSGEKKQSFFTFESRSELERARFEMKIYLQLHKRLKQEKSGTPKPDPDTSSTNSHEETNNIEDTSTTELAQPRTDSLSSKPASVIVLKDNSNSSNSTETTLSSHETPSATESQVKKSRRSRRRTSKRRRPPLRRNSSDQEATSRRRPLLRKISSEPHIGRHARNPDDSSNGEGEIQSQHRHNRRRRPLLRKASSDGDMRQQERRPPLRKASSERDMLRPDREASLNGADYLVLRKVPPPPPQPIILTTTTSRNQDTLVPVVMNPGRYLEQPRNAVLQQESRVAPLQPYQREGSIDIMGATRANARYDDMEKGISRQHQNENSAGENHDDTDSITIPKRRCAQCSAATLCCCFCCTILALAIFLIVYFTVIKDRKSSADEAREDFFSSADGAFWVRS